MARIVKLQAASAVFIVASCDTPPECGTKPTAGSPVATLSVTPTSAAHAPRRWHDKKAVGQSRCILPW
jgi:hypothetical protein